MHYIVHLQCTFPPFRTHESKGFWLLAWVRGQRKTSQVFGRVWAAGFHLVTAHSCLAGVWKLNFPIFFRGAVNRIYWISGYGGTTVYVSPWYWTHHRSTKTPKRTKPLQPPFISLSTVSGQLHALGRNKSTQILLWSRQQPVHYIYQTGF
jgi:hypothetical protein